MLRRLAAAALVAASVSPAEAGGVLPDGGHILVDELLPGVDAGIIIPIYIHMQVTGTEAEVTFATIFPPDLIMCEAFGKCGQAVPALSLSFAEDGDGRITVTDREIHTGPGLTIDREDVDVAHIIEPVADFLDGARVTEDGHGLRLTNGFRSVRLMPGDLRFMLDAMAFAASFDISLAPLDQCILRQVATLAAKPERSPREEEVLLAVKVYGELARIDAMQGMIVFDPATPDPAEQKTLRAMAIRWALAGVVRRLMDTEIADAPLPSDAELDRMISEELALFTAAGDRTEAIRAEVMETRAPELRATIRYQARFFEAMMMGYVIEELVCRSILLETQ